MFGETRPGFSENIKVTIYLNQNLRNIVNYNCNDICQFYPKDTQNRNSMTIFVSILGFIRTKKCALFILEIHGKNCQQGGLILAKETNILSGCLVIRWLDYPNTLSQIHV